MKQKQQLEELLHAYMDVFWDPKGLPPKREVEHEIELLWTTHFQTLGCISSLL